MRLQPLDNAHVNASVHTSATTMTEWIQEWLQLVSYGPTYDRLEWTVPPQTEEAVRLQLQSNMNVELKWSDHSVAWEKHVPGTWTMDITKAVDVTLYVRADIGEYVKQRSLSGGPASVKAIQLKPYLEIGCDDEIPFALEKPPVANMYWNAQINVQQIVNPDSS